MKILTVVFMLLFKIVFILHLFRKAVKYPYETDL